MPKVEFEGWDRLDLVARTLRDLGDKQLTRELYRGLNKATAGLKRDAKEQALEKLPRRGGLNQRVADKRLTTRRRSGRNPGVRITAGGRRDQLAAMDDGQVRHPVYGHRDRWVTQEITPGWFTVPMEAGGPEVREEIVRVLDDVAAKVAAKVQAEAG